MELSMETNQGRPGQGRWRLRTHSEPVGQGRRPGSPALGRNSKAAEEWELRVGKGRSGEHQVSPDRGHRPREARLGSQRGSSSPLVWERIWLPRVGPELAVGTKLGKLSVIDQVLAVGPSVTGLLSGFLDGLLETGLTSSSLGPQAADCGGQAGHRAGDHAGRARSPRAGDCGGLARSPRLMTMEDGLGPQGW